MSEIEQELVIIRTYKEKKMTRIIGIVFLIVFVFVGSAFAGGRSESAGTVASTVAPAGAFPIVEEPVVLKFFARDHASVTDWENNAMTEYMENLTNIRIQWELVPQAVATERRTLALASRDLPDAFFNSGMTAEEEILYGSQGVLVPLNDMIEELGYEIKKMFDLSPQTRDVVTTPDGNIYALPRLSQTYHMYFRQKMWINSEWLENLGLKMPTTTDEFFDVLVAFRDRDANANGNVNDEIPLSYQVHAQYFAGSFLLNSFLYFNSADFLAVENGTVVYSPTKEQFREGLKFLAMLYRENLIDPQSFTQTTDQIRQLGEDNRIGASVGNFWGTFVLHGGERGMDRKYEAVPPLYGPGGFRSTGYHPFSEIRGNYAITSSSRNQEAAFRYADHLFGREATLRSVKGRPGVEWQWARDGQVGVNGLQAIWERLPDGIFGTPGNHSWAITGPSFRPAELRLGEVAFPDMYDPRGIEVRLYRDTAEKYDVGIVPEQVVPPLYVRREDASEFAQNEVALREYVVSSMAEFITGRRDPSRDGDWNAFLQDLDRRGLASYLSVVQSAFDSSPFGRRN